MSKQNVIKFNRELTNLFNKRISWLRNAIEQGAQGRPPKCVKRKEVSQVIKKLQDLASRNLSKTFAQEEFKKTINQKKQWQVRTSKGWGRQKKKENFDSWFKNSIHFSNCIYIFWNKSTCIYIGRTIKGKGRPQDHFNKYWFDKVTRIDIYSTKKVSCISKLECLAIHRFHPTKNGIKASIPKWARKCPVCETQKAINTELRRIFNCRR